MNRSRYQDSAFAYVTTFNGEKFRMLLHHDSDGNVDIDSVEFCLSLLEHIPFKNEEDKSKSKSHLLIHKAHEIFKSEALFNLYERKRSFHSFRAVLNGGEEVPPVTTDAEGQARFIYDSQRKELFYDVRFKNLSAEENAAHFHIGTHGEPGPIEITLPIGSPKFGFVELTQEQENALFAGQIFVNIHTPNYPEGEIRGQLMPHSETENKIVSSEQSSVQDKEKKKEQGEEKQKSKKDEDKAKENKDKEKDKKKKKRPAYSHIVQNIINPLLNAETVLSEDRTHAKEIDNMVHKALFDEIVKEPACVSNGEFFGVKAQLVEVTEEGSVKFFRVKVGEPDFPMTMFFDVAFDPEGKPVTVRMLDSAFPAEVIPDVAKFLKSLMKN